MAGILNLLKGGDSPAEDQKTFLKAQILYWLIGPTDGHAKNFSIFLGPRGRFYLTPLYDVLTAQPSLDSHQIERKQMKLAMSVETSRHYQIEDIRGRHFLQTAEEAGLPRALASEVLQDVAKSADGAMRTIEHQLPRAFPHRIHESVKAALFSRLRRI